MRTVAGALAALALGALSGCGSTGGEGVSLGERIILAGPTVPPEMSAEDRDVHCPTVGVIEGGAAIQAYSGGRVGDASALRSQITLGQLARECTGSPDGSTVVRVGVEGRALLGASGGAGRYTVPVRIVVKRGSRIIGERVRQVSVAIPAGDTQGTFTLVEEGLLVAPADAGSFEIEVGLGGSAGRRG